MQAKNIKYNYSYFPVIFSSQEELTKAKKHLAQNEVNTRRYFFPSLNNLPYIANPVSCPVSEDISKRILCLPFYQQLPSTDVKRICSLLKEALSK